jgi:hypothetical protein
MVSLVREASEEDGPKRKKWWSAKGAVLAVGVIALQFAESVFHYRSIVGICILAFLGFIWFVAPDEIAALKSSLGTDFTLEISDDDEEYEAGAYYDTFFHFAPRSARAKAWYASYHSLKHTRCSCLDGVLTVDSKQAGNILRDLVAAHLNVKVQTPRDR